MRNDVLTDGEPVGALPSGQPHEERFWPAVTPLTVPVSEADLRWGMAQSTDSSKSVAQRETNGTSYVDILVALGDWQRLNTLVSAQGTALSTSIYAIQGMGAVMQQMLRDGVQVPRELSGAVLCHLNDLGVYRDPHVSRGGNQRMLPTTHTDLCKRFAQFYASRAAWAPLLQLKGIKHTPVMVEVGTAILDCMEKRAERQATSQIPPTAHLAVLELLTSPPTHGCDDHEGVPSFTAQMEPLGKRYLGFCKANRLRAELQTAATKLGSSELGNMAGRYAFELLQQAVIPPAQPTVPLRRPRVVLVPPPSRSESPVLSARDAANLPMPPKFRGPQLPKPPPPIPGRAQPVPLLPAGPKRSTGQ